MKGDFRADPVQIEILKNALTSIADEMALTILRTAHSTIIKDGKDFSTAICDPKGELLVQGLTVPQHLGAIPDALAAVLRHFGDNLHPGDLIIQNNPFDGAMHLQDIFVFKPVFDSSNNQLLAFACSTAHHADVGGRVPGSNASDSTEIYQEGIRFPVIKLYNRGEPNQAVLDILAANVRVPEMVLGDLRATIAACHYGEREFMKLVARYGADDLPELLTAYLDYTERLTRAEIRTLPQGTYTFEDYIDDDGITDEPIKVCVALTIRGDEVIADYTGLDHLQRQTHISPCGACSNRTCRTTAASFVRLK
jgi:N-methylhydantoinase B